MREQQHSRAAMKHLSGSLDRRLRLMHDSNLYSQPTPDGAIGEREEPLRGQTNQKQWLESVFVLYRDPAGDQERGLPPDRCSC